MPKFLSVLFAIAVSIMTTATATAADKQKVVYHVSEAEKVPFVLGNIRNHINGVGGPQNVEIILVAHGPAIDALEDVAAVDNVREAMAALQKDGVRFEMCTNTLTAKKLKLEDLLPGFVLADQGGVVRIAELQQQGYLYIRP